MSESTLPSLSLFRLCLPPYLFVTPWIQSAEISSR